MLGFSADYFAKRKRRSQNIDVCTIRTNLAGDDCAEKKMPKKKESKEIHVILTREKCESKKMSDTGTEN